MPDEYTKIISECVTGLLDGYNRGIARDEFYALNIVDTSDVVEEDMQASSSGVVSYCFENGCYAALPPFEEGAYIDKSERRYVHWKVLEVCDDYFRLQLDHYPIIFGDTDLTGRHVGVDFSELRHMCWYLANHMVVRVKVLTHEEHKQMLSHHPDFVQYADSMVAQQTKNPMVAKLKKDMLLDKMSEHLKSVSYVGGIVEDYEYYLPQDLIKIKKKGKYYDTAGNIINGAWIKDSIDTTLQYGVDSGLHTMIYTSTGPIIEMFTYINYLLSQKSTSVSTHRNITSVYVPTSEAPELRKERHFGKLCMISEKKPRAINAQNVQRVYTTLSWQRRAHVRHLASGKVVPVKSATCKRHNAEDTSAPQVVYKV